jgi:hypothetical protein
MTTTQHTVAVTALQRWRSDGGEIVTHNPTARAARVEWAQLLAVLVCAAVVSVGAQDNPDRQAGPRDPDPISAGAPVATLLRAPSVTLTGAVDSNSPAQWEIIDGRPTVVVMTSFAGRPSRAAGGSVRDLSPAVPIDISPWPGEGVWMEAVVRADDGTWYGFYHNERVAVGCGSTRVTPRIGAARSSDFGVSWTDLGILIEASPATFDCGTLNSYFVGGVGDLVALLDRDSTFVYLYFSQYGAAAANQGVAAARLAWADRDAPVGKLDTWSQGRWLPAGRFRRGDMAPLFTGTDMGRRWSLPAATALFPTKNPWHDSDTRVDAFWGPAIHWNTYLERYVMLLNKAKDETFGQEGVYVSFNTTLVNPGGWSQPVRILQGGAWYPQVIGLERSGTDTQAGRVARFFMHGRSDYIIQFDR